MSIKLKKYLQAVNYRISTSSEYLWGCYGSDVISIDCWDGRQDGISACAYYSPKSNKVYEIQFHDYSTSSAYRWIHEDYVQAVVKEAVSRGMSPVEAWDEIEYTDVSSSLVLGLIKDAFSKDVEDSRVDVELELSEELVYELMLEAHRQDITLNELIEGILEREIEKHEGEIKREGL